MMDHLTSSGFASLLGMRHALEPDHLAAVSTLVSRERNRYKAAWLGIFWGLGHTAALIAVGIVLIVMRAQLPAGVALLAVQRPRGAGGLSLPATAGLAVGRASADGGSRGVVSRPGGRGARRDGGLLPGLNLSSVAFMGSDAHFETCRGVVRSVTLRNNDHATHPLACALNAPDRDWQPADRAWRTVRERARRP